MTKGTSSFFPCKSLFGAVFTVLLAVAASLAPVPAYAAGSVAMHRLYNRYTGEHFYTASDSERDGLVAVGWRYEGVGWVAPASGDAVYRLYNPYVSGGDHHYTPSEVERDSLVAKGWRYEGVGWRSGGDVEVLRQYNPYATTGTHNYTTSAVENDHLVSVGWRAEGVGWRALEEGRLLPQEQHFWECEYFYIDVPDAWQQGTLVRVGNGEWNFSYPSGPYVNMTILTTSSTPISGHHWLVGTTSGGVQIWANDAATGFFGSGKATITLK